MEFHYKTDPVYLLNPQPENSPCFCIFVTGKKEYARGSSQMNANHIFVPVLDFMNVGSSSQPI